MKIAVCLIGILILLCIIILVIDSGRFVVRRYSLTSDKIHKPVTFVFVSDLHGKSYGRDNQKLFDAIDAVRPDFVLCGGDIPTAHPGASLSVATAFMQKLCAKYKVYYANGNHEYRMRIYPDKYEGMHETYEKAIKHPNHIRLINESVSVNPDIVVHGLELERKYYRRIHKVTPEPSHIRSLFKGEIAGADCFHILLAHNPDYFASYAACGCDLVLSGHLHGGVARLPLLGGIISPSLQLFPKYDGGMFVRGDTTMIVSRGLGMHTIPLRFLNPGELLAVTLMPKQ